jgi:hypothetical protein
MTLLELEAEFLKWIDDSSFRRIESIAEADGIIFVCPKCFAANGNKRPGVHSVICWSPSVPQTTRPVPGRWNLVGTSLNDLSLVAGSSSVLLTGPGCGAHFFVRNGRIEGCS